MNFRAKVLRVLFFLGAKRGRTQAQANFCECSGSPSNVGAKSCAQKFSQYDNIIAQDFHSAPNFNGGVVFKQAKNEKADAACLAPAFILFVFHLNQARQNRTFAKRYLERNDCSARSAAQAERGGFPRQRRAALSRNSPWKQGKTAAERVGFSPQASKKSKGGKSSQLFPPLSF